MIVSIHQPEHFPYMGFFQKMNESDLFIILDDVKFKKNNFQNRNRFLNINKKEEWFTVPVEKRANSKLIKDVLVAESSNWKKKLVRKMAINFGLDLKFLEYLYEDNLICAINLKSIDYCRDKLKISTPYILSSDLIAEGAKTRLIINLCKEVRATHYISGKGGLDYLDINLFLESKIQTEIFEPKLKDYYTTLCHI